MARRLTRLENQLREQGAPGKKSKSASPTTKRSLKEEVRAHAKKTIRRVANSRRKTGWGPPQLRYALAYLEWLLGEGGRGRPDPQQANVDSVVQRCFAAACVEHQVPDKTFHGQSLAWYPEREAEAIKSARTK